MRIAALVITETKVIICPLLFGDLGIIPSDESKPPLQHGPIHGRRWPARSLLKWYCGPAQASTLR